MWSDSEDLAVLADMSQIKVKVITIGHDDNKPTVNWIYPDAQMKDVAASNEEDIHENELVLLHDNDNHYNLIIKRTAKVVRDGSLSYNLKNNKAMNFKQVKEVKH